MLKRACVLLVALAVAVPGYGQSGGSPEVMLENGIRAELVDGDLAEAISIYESIVVQPDVGRDVVARALLQIAGCYDKLGQPDALVYYERVASEFADQVEPAAVARERLRQNVSRDVVARLVWSGRGAPGFSSLTADGRQLLTTGLSQRDFETGFEGRIQVDHPSIRITHQNRRVQVIEKRTRTHPTTPISRCHSTSTTNG